MSGTISTKPYLLRAIHEWCTDNGFTPYLAVAVNGRTRVPMAYVKDSEIVLNVNYSATRNLVMDNDAVTFSARFNGVAMDIYVPMDAVRGIFSRENGQGMFFAPDEDASVDADASVSPDDGDEPPPARPTLRVVK